MVKKKMKVKELLVSIVNELSSVKNELRRLKRQINELNDSVDQLIPQPETFEVDVSENNTLISEEEWASSVNATYQVPFEARTTDIEVKDNITFINASAEEYKEDKYGDGK